MTNEQVNKIIHEARGLCWHEVHQISCKVLGELGCPCGFTTYNVSFPLTEEHLKLNPDYTSNWSDYGPVLKWAQDQVWWLSFFFKVGLYSQLLSPKSGSYALAQYLTENPK